ncbi:glycosyltransferase [Flagellimonas okinawensis]|uniref:Glycosyltransferase n=1 Tax=Flagellimonas okinawensis TaxID=3031324 RepID=A0ABT5XR07_9FLAO|nr:glycosyltransferase [[Muricauda] okinawensis]MDF0708333.1 glycosyltransferase [[Muricauda] okinawensis]
MNSKKKLSIFINNLNHGGAQKIASVLMNELSSEFEIFLVLIENSIVYEVPNSVKIEVLGKKNKSNLFDKFLNVFRYHSFCKKNSIEVSLSLLTQPNYISALTKIFGSKTKVVLSEHTYQSLWRANEKVYATLKKIIISLLYNKADKIITVSNKIRLDLIENYGVKKDKVVTVFNPYPIEKINSLSKVKIEEESNNSFNFVTVGTLYHVKNQELLLRSFAKLKSENIHLRIVGDGELKEHLIKLSKELNIHDKVTFVGFTDNPFKYLGTSDVFVLSSNNEGLPNVIIEALACECAVVSTDCISGPREILAPGTSIDQQLKDTIEFADFGILVPIKNENLMAEAMEKIIEDSKLLNNYKEKSFERALFFDAKNSVRGYIENLQPN